MIRHRITHASALVALAGGSAFAQPAPAPAPAPTPSLTDEELLAAADKAAEAAEADPSADGGGEVITVEGTAPAESASSVHFTAKELQRRPHSQPSDLLRQIPGLVVAQHAGGGKSDQYFLRGFDADHGTDVALFLDGVPVNMTSHGHGQGYADSHWMIPETIGSVDMHKGPYAARYGDFYTAGAIEMRTIDSVERPTVYLSGATTVTGPTAGDHLDRRMVGLASPALGDGKGLLAVEVGESDGPFITPQGFRRSAALGKWKMPVGPGELSLATTYYSARWNQSGQLPAAEVAAGRLDRFGAIDPTEGGTSSRGSLALGYTVRDDSGAQWSIRGYGVSYRLRLFSNFTLFMRDPVNGDQIEQDDTRLMYGVNGAYTRRFTKGSVDALVTAGVEARADNVETELWHSAARQRLADCFEVMNPCNHTDNKIRDLAAYAEAQVSVGDKLQLMPGLRIDQYTWDVDDLDAETMLDPEMTTGGFAGRAIVSPKLSAIYKLSPELAVFANGGIGFHSNDARAAVKIDGPGALARAYGAEAGARVQPMPGFRASADFWYLYLGSEQVWVGDNGGTEPSDPTRRYGIDVEAAWDLTPNLSIDANVSIGRSSVVANQGNGGALALAPRLMGGAGIAYHRGDDTLVSLRTRGIGSRPANDDGSLTAEGFLLVDLVASQQLMRNVRLGLSIVNLLDAEWREAQFADDSRVTPTAEVKEDVHFTPGQPLTAMLELGLSY
jgi:outer membrane receptor protein involved in Fe transport